MLDLVHISKLDNLAREQARRERRHEPPTKGKSGIAQGFKALLQRIRNRISGARSK